MCGAGGAGDVCVAGGVCRAGVDVGAGLAALYFLCSFSKLYLIIRMTLTSIAVQVIVGRLRVINYNNNMP